MTRWAMQRVQEVSAMPADNPGPQGSWRGLERTREVLRADREWCRLERWLDRGDAPPCARM
jgi:hypothetical protein